MEKPIIRSEKINKILLIVNLSLALIYFAGWLIPSHVGNLYLYLLLFVGEIYHLFMAVSLLHNLWPGDPVPLKENLNEDYHPNVDIFITVVNEPLEVIAKTIMAAKNIDYPNYKIYVLNDGRVAGNPNWQKTEELARRLEVNCVTRIMPGGAKAGNINHALRGTESELIVIFDADMVAYPDFLKKTVHFFTDPRVGFVQTPQYYENFTTNELTSAAWKQQEFFFGPIMKGKEKSNAVFICGTNVIIRRKALNEVGGMYEKSIAEDFMTSLLIHQKGWFSRYVPEVLAKGLAPQDLLSYYKQQFRWARGSLDVIFGHNPLFLRGLTWSQKWEYLVSSLYYLNGPVVLIDALMPLLFLFFGIGAVMTTTSSFAILFLPYMFFTLYTLYIASDSGLTLRAIAFSYSSWFLQLSALRSVIFREKVKFSVTPKQEQTGNFIFLAYPHLLYVTLAISGWLVAFGREGIDPSVATNMAWTAFNMIMFLPFISASLPRQEAVSKVSEAAA